jgi:DNA-binding transcriptional ArsR family regulator
MAGSRRRKKRNNNHALLAALRHPLRRRILRLMSDGREASPSEIAKQLGEDLSKVAYHVRVLADAGALEVSGEQPVRGATKHFYSESLDAEWAETMLDENED